MDLHPLAVKLKDAKFPISHDVDRDCLGRCEIPSTWGDEELSGEILHYPTLGEVIEACGDKFLSLIKTNQIVGKEVIEDCWQAAGLLNEPYDVVKVNASNAKTAVYQLWLMLNK